MYKVQGHTEAIQEMTSECFPGAQIRQKASLRHLVIHDGGCWSIPPNWKFETERHDFIRAKTYSSYFETISTYTKSSSRPISVFYSCVRLAVSSHILATMADITLRSSKALLPEHFFVCLPVLGGPQDDFIFVLLQELCRGEFLGAFLQLAAVCFSSVFTIFHAQHFSPVFCSGKERLGQIQ